MSTAQDVVQEAEQVVERANIPPWYSTLTKDYQAGVAHTFMLHGGIYDYTDYSGQDLTVREYIAARMARVGAVVTYSIDEGIRFPNDEDGTTRRRFEMAAGLQQEQDEAAKYLRGEAPSENNLPTSPGGALPLLVDYLRKSGPTDDDPRLPVVIVDRFDLIAPPGDKATLADAKLAVLGLMHRAGTDQDIDGTGGIFIMLAPTQEEVHGDLRTASSGIRVIEVPPPNVEQRLGYIRRIIETKELKLLDITETEFAAGTAGLFRRHIEDIGLRAAAVDKVLTRSLVRQRKREQMLQEYAGALELVEPEYGFEAVGGHDLVIGYFREWLIPTILDPELADEAPTGVLLMGPSGTGKTFLVRAAAREAGVNFVIADPMNMRGKYVGESEAKTARFIQGLSAMAPCFVLFDEVDQKLRRGTGEGGSGGDAVENNIFGKMLEFLGDESRRGSVVAFAATNRPDNMDAALKRPGRFGDMKVPILPPQTPDERMAVLRVLCNRYMAGRKVNLDSAVQAVEGWTQAEMEALIKKSRTFGRIKKLKPEEAIKTVLATMRSATKDIEFMALLALSECDDAALVPEKYRGLVGDAAVEKREAARPRERATRGYRDVEL
jgi:hypothetical protein